MSTATGTIQHQYSDSDACICCPGKHRYATKFIPDGRLAVTDYRNNIRDWVSTVMSNLPEGAKVRVTVEVLP